MQYTIKITQTREGYVQIEAENARDALTKAEDLYNGQGHVLPDLDVSAERMKGRTNRSNL